MVTTTSRRVVRIVVAFLALGTLLEAADLRKSIENSESRRRTSEAGVKLILAKSVTGVDAIRAAYGEVANQHNGWLDSVVHSVNQPSPAASDVAAVATRAADALVAFVVLRNRALGEMELAGVAAESVRKVVVRDLTDIANEFWRDNGQRDAKRRETATKALVDRLRWKSWDQIQ